MSDIKVAKKMTMKTFLKMVSWSVDVTDIRNVLP